MEENLKTSIFNPKDKLNESTNFNEKIYLEFVPNDKNIFDDKMKSKYSNEIYEITKLNNNSLIIKNDKNDFLKLKKMK